jgi:hypothetical protein
VLQPALATDLRVLMRGPGAQVGQGLSRIGPTLRVMCGIAPNDSADDAIAAVAAWLHARIARLDSEELRICVSSVFGLHEAAQLPSASARVNATAQQLQYGATSVWRRVDTGIASIAASTTPADSVLHQLHEHANSAVELGHVLGAREEMRITKCFLITALHLIDQPGKIYALVRHVDRPDTVAAIPAVWIRHVTAVPSSGPNP